jgi:pSer/pThr/pTyr-binding forkhead associated (FHA) protein
LRQEGSGLAIKDLDSRNGTMVNGRQSSHSDAAWDEIATAESLFVSGGRKTRRSG